MSLFDIRFQALKPYEDPENSGHSYGEIGIHTPSDIVSLHTEFACAIELALSCGTDPETLGSRLGALIDAAIRRKSALLVDDPIGQYENLCGYDSKTLKQLHNCFLTAHLAA